VSEETNRRRFHWREEWRKITERRRLDETEKADAQEPIPYEPWFFAWCDYFSREMSAPSADGAIKIYWLAEQYLVDEKGEPLESCPHYQSRAEADAEREQPAGQSSAAPSPARPHWKDRGGF
jgi:hypothetical protein